MDNRSLRKGTVKNGEAVKAITGGEGKNELGCVREGGCEGAGPAGRRLRAQARAGRFLLTVKPVPSTITSYSSFMATAEKEERKKGKVSHGVSLRRPKIEANRTLRSRGSGENGAAAVRRAR